MIFYIVAMGVALVFVLYVFQRRKVAAKAASHGGAALVSAAEQIPVYGQIVKAVATVGRPVNRQLNKLNKGISEGLHHIPVVGHYLAMPNEVAGKYVYKLNDWLGLN